LRDNVFVSTGAFRTKDLAEILDLGGREGITNLELSAGIDVNSYSESLLTDARPGFNFLIHNYFPPEPTNLVINLASGNVAKRQASLDFCKEAIDLCVRLSIPLYTVHSGFCYDPKPEELGAHQAHLPRIGLGEAKANFWESLATLQQYGAANGVEIAIENNIVPEYNLVDGKNEIDLMSSPVDYDEMFQLDELVAVKVLVDIGHLKVTARSEHFSMDQFMNVVEPRVAVLQLSDNDGVDDDGRGFDVNAWFVPHLSRFSDKYFVVEAHRLDFAEIHASLEVIDNAIA